VQNCVARPSVNPEATDTTRFINWLEELSFATAVAAKVAFAVPVRAKLPTVEKLGVVLIGVNIETLT